MDDSVHSVQATRVDSSTTEDNFAACLSPKIDEEITFLDTATSTNELTAYLNDKAV